jgi:hypothetical protein
MGMFKLGLFSALIYGAINVLIFFGLIGIGQFMGTIGIVRAPFPGRDLFGSDVAHFILARVALAPALIFRYSRNSWLVALPDIWIYVFAEDSFRTSVRVRPKI